MSVRTWIKDHEILYFWSRILKESRNSDFRQRVLDITDHPALARIERLGDSNPDTLFYLIDIDDAGCHSGFFALLNDTVKRLELARRLGAKPYIRWRNTAYSADETTDSNEYTLFFSEPCDSMYEEILKSSNVIISRPEDGYLRDESQVYHEKNGFLTNLAQLYARYIVLRPEIEAKIRQDQSILMMEEKKTIGIHIRGGDYHVGLKGHPKVVEYESYEQAMDTMLRDLGPESRFFLATDDARVLGYFKQYYGEKVINYQDAFRTNRDLGVHYTRDKRRDHGFLLGYEVLRDVDTLSRCAGLVAGVSNVSFTARAWKEARGEHFETVRILNGGINETGVSSVRFNRRYNEGII